MRVTDTLRTSLAARFVGGLGGKGVVLGVLGAVVGAEDPTAGVVLSVVPSTAVTSTRAASRPDRGRRNGEDEQTPVIPRRCPQISMIANMSHTSVDLDHPTARG
ncbi:hypothetical protein TPA0908_53710 [Micromonospora sp. AKA38]|nr:hypothetical protein TPA0908_53710 [Micromonospora sp. AKA38]